MRVKLKRINDPVIVITGASSGIGLATALMAARHSASPFAVRSGTASATNLACLAPDEAHDGRVDPSLRSG